MFLMILGLIIFLGIHSIRIFAEPCRTQAISRLGDKTWQGLYSLISLLGFILIIYGYSYARFQASWLYFPPIPFKHINSLFTLVAFIFLVATYVPRNHIKAKLHHPMILAVKVWALGHLLASGKLSNVILFGAFLLWAIFDFRAARLRDKTQNISYPNGTISGSLITIIIASVAWLVFAFWLHAKWLGFAPLGWSL